METKEIELKLTVAEVNGVLQALWAAVKEPKVDLAKLRENLPKDYISKDDYKEDIREIKSMLAKIFEKLENKADK